MPDVILAEHIGDIRCINCLVYVRYCSITTLYVGEENEHAFIACYLGVYYCIMFTQKERD